MSTEQSVASDEADFTADPAGETRSIKPIPNDGKVEGRVISLENMVIEYELKNLQDQRYYYSEAADLYIKDGQWIKVESRLGYHDIAYHLEPKDTKVFQKDLTKEFGSIPTGEYKLVHNLFQDIEGDVASFDVEILFTAK